MKQKVLLVGAIVIVVAIGMVVFRGEGPKHAAPLLVFGEDSSNLKAYKSLAADFNRQTGIQVNFDDATFEQSLLKAEASFQLDEGGFDIVLQYNFSLAPYVKKGYIVDIHDVFSPRALQSSGINDNLFQNALRETCFYYTDPQVPDSPPAQFGFPFAANTMLLVYNRDLFEDPVLVEAYRKQSGKDLVPPSDWNEYFAIAEFFATIRPDLKGVCMQGASGGWLYYELCNYLFGMGTGTSTKTYGWEENKPLSIATPQNEEVLRYCKRLKAYSAGDYFTVGAPQQLEIMLKGKTAMGLMWSDYIQPLAKSNGPRFGFAPTPGIKSGLAGGAFYINRRSRNMEAAAEFVLFALSAENQEKLIKLGLCSPLKTAYTDEVMGEVAYAKALRDSLERGVFMFEAGTDAGIIDTALTTSVQKYMRGEIDEVEALNQAQKDVLTKRAKSG